MLHHPPESGAVPVMGILKIGLWVWTAWEVGSAVYDYTEADAEADAARFPPGKLGDCLKTWGGEIPPDPLSPSARAYWTTQIQNWRAYAANELGGDAMRVAVANATIDNVINLINAQSTPDGQPVTLCDAQAGALVIETQINKLKSQAGQGPVTSAGAPTPPTTAPATMSAPSSPSAAPWVIGGIAAVLAASGWWWWRSTR